MTTMNRTPKIGSVISGTLRTEDLLFAFSVQLLQITDHSGNLTIVDEADAMREALAHGNGDEEQAQELVNDLISLLDEYAPPGTYFGAHEGDGADFGFWPIDEDA